MAKDYVQKQTIHFEEAFAPVTHLESVQLLIVLSTMNGCEVHHLDVKLAFICTITSWLRNKGSIKEGV